MPIALVFAGHNSSCICHTFQFLDCEPLDVKFMRIPFVCTSYDDDKLDDVQMIICLSSMAPSIVGNRVDYAMQEGIA